MAFKKNKKVKYKTKTISQELIFWYTTLLLSVVTFTVVLIIILVGLFMYNDIERDMDKIEKQIALNSSLESENLSSFLEDVLYPFDPSIMLKIENSNGTSSIYSRDWNDSLERMHNYLFFQDVFKDDDNLYYGDTFILENGNTVEIYRNIDHIVEFLYLLMRIGLIVVIASLTISLIFVVRRTKRIISPINELTKNVLNINLRKDLSEGITVPATPREVQNLGSSFNDLIKELDYYIENEKKFVSNASHELRNPVAAILGNVNLIIRRGKEHPDIMDRSIRAIHEEALRMEKLLEQLLKMARLENFENEMEIIDLSKVLSNYFEGSFTLVKDLKLELKLNEEVFVRANKDLIIQVLRILLDNAQKYSEVGDKIKVSLNKIDGYCKLEVKDTGVGIPNEDLDKIFNRFYRVDKNRSRSTGGTGLGLSMAKDIVHIHRGRIEVFSQYGMGTVFKITLDLVEKEE